MMMMIKEWWEERIKKLEWRNIETECNMNKIEKRQNQILYWRIICLFWLNKCFHHVHGHQLFIVISVVRLVHHHQMVPWCLGTCFLLILCFLSFFPSSSFFQHISFPFLLYLLLVVVFLTCNLDKKQLIFMSSQYDVDTENRSMKRESHSFC